MNLFIIQGSLSWALRQSGITRGVSECQVLTGKADTFSSYAHALTHCMQPYKAFCGFHMEIVSRACCFSISYLCTAICIHHKVYAKCLLS